MINVEFNYSFGCVHYNYLKPGDFFKIAEWSKQIYMKTQNGHIFITSYDPNDKNPPEKWFNISECDHDFKVIPINCVLKILSN